MHPRGACVLCETEPAPLLPSPLEGLSIDDIRAEHRRRRVAACTHTFAEFFRDGWHVLEPTTPLSWSWHLEEVCNHIQQVIEDWAKRQTNPKFVQRVRDLLVSLGPGTGKSRIGVYLIPWIWLRWPSFRAICLSANPRVALRDSMLSREVIGSDWYQGWFTPSWKIRDDADAKGSYVNTGSGFRNAAGIDARIVGERGDLIWIDDPHDPDEVSSDAKREGVHERWMAIGDRLNDLSVSLRMAIAHRTHPADWSSKRIEEGWCELRLPTEFDAGAPCRTPFGGDRRTVHGESLHPARLTPEVIAKEKKRLLLKYNALHQQDPANAGGAMIKIVNLRFHRAPGMPDARSLRPVGCFDGPAVETPSAFDAVCIAADLAGGKETTRGDYNAIVAVGKRAANFFLLRAWRRRADFPVVQREFRSFCDQYPLSHKIVEAAASGMALVTSLVSEIPGLIGRPVKGDKATNMQPVLAFFEAGNVFLDENHPELAAAPDGDPGLVTELAMFGTGKGHDDFADAFRMALVQLALVDAAAAEKRKHLVRYALMAFNGRDAKAAVAFVNAALARAEQPPLSEGEIAASPRLSGATAQRARAWSWGSGR